MARKTKSPSQADRTAIVQDFELWTEIARTVTPLNDQSGTHQPSPIAQTVAVERSTRPQLPGLKHAASLPSARTVPPPLSGLDRRTSRKLTRGKTEIDDRIDLHGETGETAHTRLLAFLSHARARGARTVLVITGKGRSQFSGHTLHGSQHFHAPERQGRLRRLVTQWFEEPEFRLLVAGYQPAHPRHGGGGAFYVRLRRSGRNRPIK